jgi:hypothetical protein
MKLALVGLQTVVETTVTAPVTELVRLTLQEAPAVKEVPTRLIVVPLVVKLFKVGLLAASR